MKILIALILLAGLVGCSKKDDCCNGRPIDSGAKTERVKDPVCGMWVEKNSKARDNPGTVIWDNGEYFFCSKDCVVKFMENPATYVQPCNCSKTKHDCECLHCQNKTPVNHQYPARWYVGPHNYVCGEPCDCR